MNYEALKFWVDVAQFAVTGGIGIYLYLVNKNDATNKRIARVEHDNDRRLDNHETRITTVETALKAFPTHNDVAQLNKSVATVQSDVAALQAETKTQTALIGRIHDWLIDRAK